MNQARVERIPAFHAGSINNELPFQTFERITGRDWPGGKTSEILTLLYQLGIKEKPGSMPANLKLQAYLLKLSGRG
jgi:hypothetical protein